MGEFPKHVQGEREITLEGFIEATLSASWCRMHAATEYIETTSGTPAGNALGDAVFLLAFAGVMRSMVKALDAQGLILRVTLPADAAEVLGLSEAVFEPALYMDDIEIPTFGPAPDIAAASGSVAAIARKTLERHMLVMNTSPGKSEVMIFFGGPGSEKTRRKVLTEQETPSILLAAPYAGERIGVVTAYKHLGAKMAMGQSMQQEISHRIISARRTCWC